MTLEVEMPHPTMAGMKQKGRVYVCDLAGTEPAGDIVFAKYEKKVFPNGDIEHKYLGPHDDDRKTKELQVQRTRDVELCVRNKTSAPVRTSCVACYNGHHLHQEISEQHVVVAVSDSANTSTRALLRGQLLVFYGRFLCR